MPVGMRDRNVIAASTRPMAPRLTRPNDAMPGTVNPQGFVQDTRGGVLRSANVEPANYSHSGNTPSMQGLFAATGGGRSGGYAPSPVDTRAEDDRIYERDRAERDRQHGILRAETLADRASLTASMGGSGGGPQLSTGPSPDGAAARASAFARAKDQAGQTGRASLDTLNGVLSGRGMVGSGLEAVGQASVVNNTADEVNDFTNRQLSSDLDYAGQIENRNFQANENRNAQSQNINAQNRQSLMSLLRSSNTVY